MSRASDVAVMAITPQLGKRRQRWRMRVPSDAVRPGPWYTHIWKLVAAVASTGAALVSIFGALHSFGLIGHSDAHETIGNLGVTWVGIRPAADTATAIGDTLHFAATITDRNGAILLGTHPAWSTDDPRVAIALADGSVIARGVGTTRISVAVGSLLAHARVVVRQRIASLAIRAAAADSFVVVPEGGAIPLHLDATDARGHHVRAATAAWHVDDSTVAAVDTVGIIAGRSTGRTIATATIGDVSARAEVSVFATASAVEAISGAGQHADAGTALPQPIVVRLTSRRGRAVDGQLVTFRAVDGGAASPDTARSDADGRARTSWTLGDIPGCQTLLARVERLDSALAITAMAEPAAANTRLTAVTQAVSGVAGMALDQAVAVRVTDSSGRALTGIPVAWTAVDGTVNAPDDQRTDSLGEARAHWTLGQRAGTQRLRARIAAGHGIQPVTFTAHARSGTPFAVMVIAGDRQRASAGKPLHQTIVLRVVDAHGNGVAGAAMLLSPSAGELPDSSITADSSGTASIRWTLGRASGEQSLAVHVDGVHTLVKLTAHALPTGASNLSFEDAPGRRARASSGAKRLAAVVTDVYGNPVPDVRVNFTTRSGSVSPARAVTDAAGRVIVSWVPGSTSGERMLSGSAAGGEVHGRYLLGSESNGSKDARRQKTP